MRVDGTTGATPYNPIEGPTRKDINTINRNCLERIPEKYKQSAEEGTPLPQNMLLAGKGHKWNLSL